MALQCVVRLVAAGRRYEGPHAGPWLDAVVGEPPGTPVRRVAPWPGAPLDAPSRVVLLDGPWQVVPLDGPWQVVPLDGLLAQLRRLDLVALGRTSRCSPQSRRHQEEMLQHQRRAEARSQLPHASSPGVVNAQAQKSFAWGL